MGYQIMPVKEQEPKTLETLGTITLEDLKKSIGVLRVKIIQQSVNDFCEILEHIDQRAMAADGDVTPTIQEATPAELRQLYVLADRVRKAFK